MPYHYNKAGKDKLNALNGNKVALKILIVFYVLKLLNVLMRFFE